MFKVTAILCILAVHGENLCISGDIPLNKPVTSLQMCINTMDNISNTVNDEFVRRGILLEMTCKQIGEAI